MPPMPTPDGPGDSAQPEAGGDARGSDEVRVPGLTLVMPALDEEENVEGAIEDALAALPTMADRFEVIVVDDGSTDATAARLLKLLAVHHPTLRVLRHERNFGYGAALRTGWASGRYELLAYTDSDRQFDVAELSRLLPPLRDADLVVGYRAWRQDPVHRRVVGWIYSRLVSVLFGLRVRDVNCALKVMHAGLLSRVKLESSDFFIDCELVVRARREGVRMSQVAVSVYPRRAGHSKVRSSDVPRTLGAIARMWRQLHVPTRRRLERRPAATRSATTSALEVAPPTISGSGGHVGISR